MVKLLEEDDVDRIQEQVDLAMTTADEESATDLAALGRFDSAQEPPDLSDGGRVGAVTLTPMLDGRKVEKGRAVARQAWMWNGTESLLPLSWQPDGKIHDGARYHLLKRHCLCCQQGGFRGSQCPNCVKANCSACRASTVAKKVIACFYLRKEDVPFPARFYGNINCFLDFCPRRDSRGFLKEEDMRMHARTRHKMEYQAHLEAQAASKVDELETLRARLDAMTAGPTAVVAPEGAIETEVESEPEPVPAHVHRYKKTIGSECKVAGCDVVRRTAYKRRKQKRSVASVA